MRSLSLLLTGTVVWLATLVSPSLATDFSKFGPFAVGLQRFEIPDVTGNYPLATMVWYPAAGAAPDPAATTLHTTEDAPPAATGPYPLVVLIHGLSGNSKVYGPWGELLASYGFVVFASNYDIGLFGSASGVDPRDQVSLHLLYNRPANAVRVIEFADTLTAPGGKFAGVIDTSRIGVWGHSTGGTTALQAGGAQIDLKAMDAWCAVNVADIFASETCRFVGHEQAVAARYGASGPFAGLLPPMWDSRVAAVVLAAPGGELHAFGDAGIAAAKVPMLIMVSSIDAVVKPEFNALWAYDGIGSPSRALAIFAEGGHLMFIGRRQSDAPKALTTAFFLAILKGDAAARSALMPDAVSFPGLIYRTTLQ